MGAEKGGRLFGKSLSNNQAAFLILSLTALQIISIGIILENPQPEVSPTGFAAGQVEGNVQNEAPTNLNHTVTSATEEYGGYPAVRLGIGESILVEGNETDVNGEDDVAGTSDCVWDATGFTSTTGMSFTSCNATHCDYFCSLTLSDSTPSGTLYNITTRVIDSYGLTSTLQSSFYLHEFSIPSPTPTPSAAQSLGGSGGSLDIFILIPIPPSATPGILPVTPPSPTPVTLPTASPSVPPGFNFEIITPDKIGRCEIADAIVEVENSAAQKKEFAVEVGSMRREFTLNAWEVRKIIFKIKAPMLDEKLDLLFQARLYMEGIPVAAGQEKIELDWNKFEICASFNPTNEFDSASGRESVGSMELTVLRGSSEGLMLEVELLKGRTNVFLDIADPAPESYSKTIRVFETGEYVVKARLRKGFETVEEKVEKVEAVD